MNEVKPEDIGPGSFNEGWTNDDFAAALSDAIEAVTPPNVRKSVLFNQMRFAGLNVTRLSTGAALLTVSVFIDTGLYNVTAHSFVTEEVDVADGDEASAGSKFALHGLHIPAKADSLVTLTVSSVDDLLDIHASPPFLFPWHECGESSAAEEAIWHAAEVIAHILSDAVLGNSVA